MATNPTLERLNKTKGNSGTNRAATSTESTTVNPTIARLNGQMNKTVQQESKTKTNETPSAQNNTVTEEKTTLGDRLLDMLRSTWNTAAGATKASAAMSLNTAKDLDDAVNNQKIATKNAASRVDLYQSMADNATSADDKKRYQMMADNAKRAAGIIADENSAYNSHPLNNAIEKTTTSALSNYQKSNEYAESAREGLGKVGSTIVDAVQTTANMAAPIAVGALTGGVGGAIATGVQSGGNAYLEKLASGSNEKQARAYGSIIGLLESATSALIGGIAKTGGKLIGSSPIEAKISAMDAGLKKGAAYLAYHNAAEINEEEVQLFLEPLVNKIIYGGDYDAPTIEDIVYTAIVTGLSTSALNARPAIKTGRTQANTASDNSITQAFSDTQNNTQNESNLTVENNTAQNAVKSVTEEQPKQVTPQTIFEIIDKSKNGRADLNKVDANSLDMKSVETSMTSGEVAMDSDGKLYRVNPSEHIDNRQYGTVSERSLNAFQFDHPDLHNYYAETAKALYDDLQNSERGGETVKIPAGRAIGDDEYIRTSRAATAEVAELLDDANLSYNDIAKALDAIINNHGQENYAAAKKVEVMLDKMLTNGYRTSYGEDVAPNAAYIQAKSEIVGSQDTSEKGIKVYRGTQLSDNPLEKNLPRFLNAADVIGKGDEVNLVPLTYYTESIDDARGYATRAEKELEAYKESAKKEYRENIITGKGNTESEQEYIDRRSKEIYKTLHGSDVITDGKVIEYSINPKSVLDLTDAGETPTIDDLYDVISKETGMSKSDIDDALVLSNISVSASEGDQFPIYLALKNYGNDVGTKFVQFMKNNGYDSVKYREDNANHYALLESQDNANVSQNDNWNGLGNADAGTLNTDFQNMQAATDEFHPINEHAAQRTAAEQMRAPSDVPVVNPITEQNISKVASTIINSPITSNDMAPILEQAVADGKFDYAPITDKDANTKAQKTISDMGGYKAAANQFIARAEFGKADKNDFALGIACYNESVSAGDNVTAFELASAIGNVAHNSAQVVQAMNIFNRLTPAGKLLTLKNYINKVNRKSESKPKKSKGAKQYVDNIDALETGRPDLAINLDEDLATAYLMAETDADRAAAWQDIVDDIASKMPATVSEKWNTWRYTSMLFNPVTVIRNTAGNAVQQGLRNTKNAVGVLMEKSINKADRTKAILTNSEADKALKSLGQEMFVSDKELAMGTGKYSEGTSQGIARDIQEARGKQVFGNSNKAVIKQVGKAAQAMNNATQWMLNNEYFGDLAFSKATYVDSFAQALKAKGITYEMAMDGKHNAQVESARAYAIDEAAKATYRDSNAFSDFVSSIAKSDYKAVNAFVDAILPYRRTPANILVRGTVDYSPIGIAKALTYDIKQMKSGNATAADVVDHLASGLTGTGILALGAYLASQGLIHIKAGDDEKEQNFLKASGYQDFALQIGDTSYTIDWLVPAAMPLFAGVAMFNGVKDNGGGLEDFLSAMTGITDVILETSMLQSINSVIENMSYAEQKVWYVLSSAITSYLGQALPTIGGKVASATDDTVRKAFVQSGKSEVEQDIDYFAQSVMRKIPGARQQMQPSIDLWGREVSNGSVAERIAEAFVSPGFISKADNSKVNKELSRLAETQGSDVYPTKVEKSFKVNGETKNLTADEYTEYAKSVGKKRYEIINELTNDSGYNKLSDENKASVISDVYELATALAKKEIDSNYKLNDEVQKAVDSGLNPSQYFIYKINRDKDGSKTVSMVEAGQTLEGMSGITDKQKGKAWQNQNAQWSEAKNPFTGTLAKAGVDPATSLAIMNKYNEIDSAGGKAKDNSYAFESYLNTLHLTSAQKSAAQNLFKFYTHIPYTKNIK